MDIKEVEFLESFLSSTLNLDKAGVAELFESDGLTLKADAINQLKSKDVERVKALQKSKFDEGVKATTKTVLGEFEKKLKEKLGVDSTKVGIELVEEIIAAKIPAGESLTEEQVKKHKAYLDLKEEQDKAVKLAVKEKETEFETYKSTIEKDKSLSLVKQKALTLFESLKPILSTDATKAAKQKEMFLRQFEEGNYRIDGERIIMLNADGTDKTDAHAKRIDFEAFVKETASAAYDFQVTDPKDSPAGGNKPAGGGGGHVKKYTFKDAKDFEDQTFGTTDTKERIQMAQDWQAQNAPK